MINWDETGKTTKDTTIKTNPFLNPVVLNNLKAMEAAGASFDVLLNISQYLQFAAVLETVPNLTVIINHRGWANSIQALGS